MRAALLISLAILLGSCGSSSPGPAAASKPVGKAKILQFYAASTKVARGLPGSLCYGVENAKRLELAPAVEEVWPAVTRCFEINPKTNTTYTLTAYGEDGSTDSKKVDIVMTAPPPRLFDLWVNKIQVQKGEDVRVCFKVENTKTVKASPGRLDTSVNCIFDKPTKTTTYKITALGGDNEEDSGAVTVTVH